MIYSVSNAMASVSGSYSSALKEMGTSLARLSSGKRFQSASEDIGGYLKVNTIQNSMGQLESAQNSISEGKGFLDLASAYASNMLDQIEDLKTAAFEMEGLTGTALTAATAKYNGILASATESLLSEYNGVALNPTAAVTYETVRMGNGGSLDLAFVAGDGVTVANLAYDTDYATTATALDAEIAKVASYASKVGGYSAQVNSQESFVNTMLENYKAAESSITAINEASEMANYVANDIRQQTAVAMMSQANVSRLAILNLYR
jgi:flagellin-like hook-associated protein FlgL